MVLVRPQRVVVALDSEGRARHAVAAATQLHRVFELDVRFVNSLNIPRVFREDLTEDSTGEGAVASSRAHLSELYREVLPDWAEIEVFPGDKSRVMTRLARQPDIDMVILGPHRSRPVIDRGSTARMVLVHTDCAVWVQKGPPREIRRILVPIDLSEESKAALRCAIELASGLEAIIHVLYCFETPDLVSSVRATLESQDGTPISERLYKREKGEFDELIRTLNWQGVEHTADFSQGRPAQRILNEQERHDLIVMGTHGRSGLARVILGSVTDVIMRKGDLPVLAIPIGDRDWQLQEGEPLLAGAT